VKKENLIKVLNQSVKFFNSSEKKDKFLQHFSQIFKYVYLNYFYGNGFDDIMHGIRKNKIGLIIIGIGLISILFPSILTPIIFTADGNDEDPAPGSDEDAGPGSDEEPDPKDQIIAATINFCPKTLNLRSKGKWVTVYISLQEGYDVNDIVIESILLEVLFRAESSPTEIADYDDDLFLDLMVKFDRQAVIGLFGLEGNEEITITGSLADEIEFEGTCSIRVINP